MRGHLGGAAPNWQKLRPLYRKAVSDGLKESTKDKNHVMLVKALEDLVLLQTHNRCITDYKFVKIYLERKVF